MLQLHRSGVSQLRMWQPVLNHGSLLQRHTVEGWWQPGFNESRSAGVLEQLHAALHNAVLLRRIGTGEGLSDTLIPTVLCESTKVFTGPVKMNMPWLGAHFLYVTLERLKS
jgi:hypothetical protein